MKNLPNVTQSDIRKVNRAKILSVLREQGMVSKQDLAQTLHFSHTTINTHIQALMEEGLVELAGEGASIGGRKPLMLQIARHAKYAFGVNIAPERVTVLLSNMAGEIEERQTLDYPPSAALEQILAQVADRIDGMIAEHNLPRGKITGVGLSIPGAVDIKKNIIVLASNIGVRDFSLAAFSTRLGLPVFAENEAITASYAEQLVGKGRDKKNFVYISIAKGIGSSIVLGGRVYRSTNMNAGEFGHIKIMDAGLSCLCGRRDCWELFASKTALLRYYSESGGLDDGQTGDPLERLKNAYRQGEPIAIQTVEKYTHFLFWGIETILLTLSPDEVIIGGELGRFMEDIIRCGRDKLKINQRFYGYENTPITASAFEENGAVLGAPFLPLNQIYDFTREIQL